MFFIEYMFYIILDCRLWSVFKYCVFPAVNILVSVTLLNFVSLAVYYVLIHVIFSRYLRRIFNEDILKELMGSGEVISELEKEWEQLVKDREALRQIFPSGESKVVLPCNLQRMIWNVQKIFHINKRAPTDLSPLRVIQGN